MDKDTLKRLWTRKEVAYALRCCTKTVDNRVKIGLLKSIKIGQDVRFDPNDNPILYKVDK